MSSLAKKRNVDQGGGIISKLIYKSTHEYFYLKLLNPKRREDKFFIDWFDRQSEDYIKSLVKVERATFVPQGPNGCWTFCKKVKGHYYTYCLEKQIFVEGFYQNYDLEKHQKYSVSLLVNRSDNLAFVFRDCTPQFALLIDWDHICTQNLLQDIAHRAVIFGEAAIERYGTLHEGCGDT